MGLGANIEFSKSEVSAVLKHACKESASLNIMGVFPCPGDESRRAISLYRLSLYISVKERRRQPWPRMTTSKYLPERLIRN